MNPRLFYAIAGCWVIAVAVSVFAVERYASQPGVASPITLAWPKNTQLSLAADKPTALLFAHPKCPCTEATIREFQRIEARHPSAFHTTVVFAVTAAQEEAWRDTRLVREARNIQSARIVFDRDGVESGRFECSVSGQILLFAPDGQMLYSGGITAARGHEGINGGQEAFEYQLAHPDSPAISFPVFGCGLVRTPSPETRETRRDTP